MNPSLKLNSDWIKLNRGKAFTRTIFLLFESGICNKKSEGIIIQVYIFYFYTTAATGGGGAAAAGGARLKKGKNPGLQLGSNGGRYPPRQLLLYWYCADPKVPMTTLC